jgi:hypothetical protein
MVMETRKDAVRCIKRARRMSKRTRAVTKITLAAATLLLASMLAGCVSSQRFAAPARQPQAGPQAVPQAPSGPYTREREDREFPAHDDRR